MTPVDDAHSFAEPAYPPLDMPAGVYRQPLTIWNDGLTLDGDIYRPENLGTDDRLPGVVLTHGWGGSKLTAERYAALFASAGMIALAFTQATWFGSAPRVVLAGDAPLGGATGEGQAQVRFIRDVVDPADWIRNFEAAVDYLGGEPNVDPDRLGAWGTSFGGGVALHVAANDARIKALSIQVAWLAPLAGKQLALARSRAIEAARGAIDPFNQTSDTAPRMPGRANLARFARYDPLGQLDRLSVPTLILDAGAEDLFPIEENGGTAFAVLSVRPGQVVERRVISGIDHYGIYFDGYEPGSQAALEWFTRHLAAAES